MTHDFTGKVAVVTGTSGIARSTVLGFAGAGGTVVALGIDPAVNASLAAETKPFSGRVVVVECDVADDAAVSAAFARHVAPKGLDVIVNSAAVHPYGTATTTSPETFARCMAVNVGSIHLTARHGIPLMAWRGGGSIINVASVQGHACQANVMAYVASKGAIHAMTRAMAIDHAAEKVRVNSVSPGAIRTPLLELAARTFDGPNPDYDEVFARFGAAHLVGRIGEPEEIANLILYLASDQAGFVTGSDFLIDGGLKAGIGIR